MLRNLCCSRNIFYALCTILRNWNIFYAGRRPLRILGCFFALWFYFSINTWQSHALITALHIICLKITERLFFWTALKGFNGLAYNCIFLLVFYYVQNYGVITEAGIVDRTSSTAFLCKCAACWPDLYEDLMALDASALVVLMMEVTVIRLFKMVHYYTLQCQLARW